MADSLPTAPHDPQPFSNGLPAAPHFDVIELLPEPCAERLRMLRQRSRDAHALVPLFDDVAEVNAARYAAERVLARLVGHRSQGGFERPETDGIVVAANRTLDKAAAEARRLAERQAAKTAAWQQIARVLSNTESWLKDGKPAGCVLVAFDGPEPKLNRNESPLDAVERHRRRVRELRADLHRIQSAPFPSSYCKQKAKAQIEQMAMRGAPSVSGLVEHDGDIAFAQTDHRVPIIAGSKEMPFSAIAGWSSPDALALVCWLNKDALIARLDAEIANESDDPAALTHDERQRQEAEVLSDLLAVEHDEAALTWRAINEKMPIEFRDDISAAALLGVEVVVAVSNGRGTSAEHGFNIFGA
jgi:hypothetical protein